MTQENITKDGYKNVYSRKEVGKKSKKKNIAISILVVAVAIVLCHFDIVPEMAFDIGMITVDNTKLLCTLILFAMFNAFAN